MFSMSVYLFCPGSLVFLQSVALVLQRILQNSQLLSLQTQLLLHSLLFFRNSNYTYGIYVCIHLWNLFSISYPFLNLFQYIPNSSLCASIYLFSSNLISSSLILSLISSVASNPLLKPSIELLNSVICFNSRISFFLTSSSLMKFAYLL